MAPPDERADWAVPGAMGTGPVLDGDGSVGLIRVAG